MTMMLLLLAFAIGLGLLIIGLVVSLAVPALGFFAGNAIGEALFGHEQK
jgi:hypothetical protein